MTWDEAELDLHERAIAAATAVLVEHWPEGTGSPTPELLAERMGIEVVLGQPEGDGAVTAVRDARGARVVLAASLPPSLRSTLLLRAIGHLSRPGPPVATDHVGDAFTRSFQWAVRMPEGAIDALRQDGLSWPEIDRRLGVERNQALAQWGVYGALSLRRQRATAGTSPRPAPDLRRRRLLEQVVDAVAGHLVREHLSATGGLPVETDEELSAGVEAYLRRMPSLSRERDELACVAAVATCRSPQQLLAEVRKVVGDANRVRLTSAGRDFAREVDLVSTTMAEWHPELSRRAHSAIVNRWAWSNR